MRVGQIVRDKQDDINKREILRPGPLWPNHTPGNLPVNIRSSQASQGFGWISQHRGHIAHLFEEQST
jgi:hypothetical protein